MIYLIVILAGLAIISIAVLADILITQAQVIRRQQERLDVCCAALKFFKFTSYTKEEGVYMSLYEIGHIKLVEEDRDGI